MQGSRRPSHTTACALPKPTATLLQRGAGGGASTSPIAVVHPPLRTWSPTRPRGSMLRERARGQLLEGMGLLFGMKPRSTAFHKTRLAGGSV